MLSSSPFLIECAFFPSWISSFWLLHVQRILGWLIICLHQEVFSSFLACHVTGSKKIAMLMTAQNATANSDHYEKIPNDFQGFHHCFAPWVFQSPHVFFNQTQRNPPSSTAYTISTSSQAILFYSDLDHPPHPVPQRRYRQHSPFGQSPPQPNMPVNTSHQRQSTQGFPYRSLHFSLARPTDGWITASCPKGQTSPC